LRRSALSIPTNLAEGSASPHTKELLQFIAIANRSLSETQYLLEFAGKIELIKNSELQQLDALCDEIWKMLRSLAISIKKKADTRSNWFQTGAKGLRTIAETDGPQGAISR
jgi:four helix bundle protein